MCRYGDSCTWVHLPLNMIAAPPVPVSVPSLFEHTHLVQPIFEHSDDYAGITTLKPHLCNRWNGYMGSCMKGDFCRFQHPTINEYEEHQIAGDSPLHVAAQQGALPGGQERVIELLNRGVNINFQNNLGDTALHYCALNGHIEIVSVLLHYRANTNITNKLGDTALHNSSSNGHTETVCLLLNSGTNIYLRNVNGATALHKAALSGCIETVKALLKVGASANVLAEDGNTPLHCSVLGGVAQIVELMLEGGELISNLYLAIPSYTLYPIPYTLYSPFIPLMSNRRRS